VKSGNLSRIIFWLTIAAVVTPALRYTVAFQVAEPPLVLFGWALNVSLVTGAAFAITYEGLCAIAIKAAFDAIPRRTRWWLPLPFAAAQILLGAFIITPVAVAQLRGVEVVAVLSDSVQWLWTIGLVMATPLSLCTAAAALAVRPEKEQQSLFSVEPKASKTAPPPSSDVPEPSTAGPPLDKSRPFPEQVRTLLSDGWTDREEICTAVGCSRTSYYKGLELWNENGGG
jgi:hypothetical protein